MALTIAEEKKQLRSNIRKTLAAIPQEELTRSDDALFARFLALPQVQQAKTIFAFWGIPGKEPETARMIQTLVSQGKRVGLPRMLPGHLMEIRQYMPDRPMVWSTSTASGWACAAMRCSRTRCPPSPTTAGWTCCSPRRSTSSAAERCKQT